MTYGDGFTQTLTYDSSYRLTGITDSNGTTTLRDLDMGYTSRDNLASVTDCKTRSNNGPQKRLHIAVVAE